MDTAVYLYCLVRSARKPAVGKSPAGLAGASRPDAHRLSDSLWLVTADVPLGTYGPEPLEARLRDLDWVAATALAHEAVVEHFARPRSATVIPTKLFTMFSSIERARAEVGQGRATIARVMKHIASAEEWGVRVTRVAAKPASGAATAVPRPSSGAAFLAARKGARDAAAGLRAAAVEAASTAHERLSRHARDVRQRPRRQEPGTNPPVLEAAFLVTTAARPRFKAEAARQRAACAAAGAELTVTGPWPAYNFVSPEAFT